MNTGPYSEIEVQSEGPTVLSEKDLVGFPSELRPAVASVIFAIGDSPESKNAEYILDYQNYDPKAKIGLPLNALSLMADILSFLFNHLNCQRIVVCLTECNQVDSVKYLNASQMLPTFKLDCSIESPPCVLYVIYP
jgi:hypothetical protein